jgi:hypothetical protein
MFKVKKRNLLDIKNSLFFSIFFWKIRNDYRISAKLFFFEFGLMYCDLWLQYIKVRKLFKGGNYSREETIRGNTVSRK